MPLPHNTLLSTVHVIFRNYFIWDGENRGDFSSENKLSVD